MNRLLHKYLPGHRDVLAFPLFLLSALWALLVAICTEGPVLIFAVGLVLAALHFGFAAVGISIMAYGILTGLATILR